jgi:hypothetical protein
MPWNGEPKRPGMEQPERMAGIFSSARTSPPPHPGLVANLEL